MLPKQNPIVQQPIHQTSPGPPSPQTQIPIRPRVRGVPGEVLQKPAAPVEKVWGRVWGGGLGGGLLRFWE